MTAQQPTTPDVTSALAGVLAELQQKLEPGDLAAIATAAKQDTENASLVQLHTDIATTLAGFVDGLEGGIGASTDPATASTVIGLLKWLKAGPVVVESRLASKTYKQVTSDTTAGGKTLASLCGGALPTGAVGVEMIPSAPIRIRDDGNPSATVGMPVDVNGWDYDRDNLATLKVFGAAAIDCWFYA